MGITRPTHQHAWQTVVCFVISYLVSIVVVNGIGGDKVSTDGKSYYTEDLTLQQLGQRHVAARFVFRSTWTPKDRHRCQEHEDWPRDETTQTQESSYSVGKLCHFEAVFPRAMGVLLDRFEVHQLSLQMSKGRWDTVTWGNGPDNGGEYSPGGAEMWARMPHEGAWESWVGLRRSLSGLYCASLDGMDDSRVHTPAVMNLPGQTAPSSNNTIVLRGTLPREPVCTENLISLIKMLPCRSKTGLGGILHPTRLFQSDYHSVSVRATATFSDGGDGNRRGSITSLTLEQKVFAVFRPRPHLPSAVPKSRKEIAREGEGGWSILTLLLPPKSVDGAPKSGRSVTLQGCSVASRSAIHVHGVVDTLDRSRANCRAEECDAFQEASSIVDRLSSGVIVTRRLGSSPAHQVRLDDEDGALESISHFMQKKLWAFDIESGGVFPVNRLDGTVTDKVRASEGVVPASPERPVADARLENFFAGRGGSRGVYVSHLVNMHPEEDAYAEFLQPVPYFMVPLVGSLQARVVTTCPSVQPPLGNHSTTPENGDAASVVPWDDGFSWQSCGEGGERNGRASFEAPGPVLGLAQNLSFTPGDGRSPAIVEARLWVPAASTLVLGFDFLKRFLTVDDFPPDPSRGFDVPPPLAKFHFPHAVVASCPAHGNNGEGQKEVATTTCATAEGARLPGRIVYAYGDAGLLDAPQPDFSMPFNVITFTSTIITFFLGTAINLLVRKNAHRPKKKKAAASKQGDRPGGFGRVREALRNAFGVRNRWRRRGPEEVNSSPPESNG